MEETLSRRGGRLRDLLWAAPLGICLIYSAAILRQSKTWPEAARIRRAANGDTHCHFRRGLG